MYKFEDGQVPLADLKPCPFKVTLQTADLLSEVFNTARSHPERIEPITVALVGNERFLVDGHLRASALGMAKVGHSRARLVRLEDLREAVRLHIELNTHGSINPIAMMDALSYIGARDSPGLVSQRYSLLARGFLHEKSRKMIEEFLADACKKYRIVEMPFYVAARLASIEDKEEQFKTVKIVLNAVRSAKESRFAFPSPADLDVIALSLRPKKAEEKEVVIFEPEEGSHGARISRKEAENLVRGSAHDSILMCTCGKRMLINTKTRAVSSIRDDERDSFVRLEGEDPARPAIMIPETALDFLEADVDSLRFVKIGSRKDLEKLASSFKNGAHARMVVILSR